MAIALVTNGSAFSADGNGFTSGSLDTSGANFIVVSLATLTSGSSISDSKGNTWSSLTEHQGGISDRYNRLFYAENATVGSGHTFTVNGTSNFPSMCIEAFSGVATTSSFDVENGAGSLGDQTTTGSVTPGTNGSLIVTGLQVDDSDEVIDSGFIATDVIVNSDFGHQRGAMAYLVQTSAGAVNPTWDWSNFARYAVSIAVFKAAAAADTLFAQSVM